MSLLKEIAKESMTEEKKKSAKNDIFAFYVGRPISYLLTVPFIKLKIKPNTISAISIIPCALGFFFVGFGRTLTLKIIGWLLFFLWNLLDGVDGNVARYTKHFSKTGSLWDATSGYIAMFLTFVAMGTGSCYGDFFVLGIDKIIIATLGGLSGCLIIFPRLVMHKRLSSIGESDVLNDIKDKSSYNLIKLIALNINSISGFLQIIMLISIIFKCMDIFTIFYFTINLLICIGTLRKLLKD